MNVRAFGVRNLRCLTETGLIRLKPITLLVGKNSSGKSTYLRAFPLFRQSLETPRSSPILWFHPGYVDFGTIQEAVNRDASPREVTFEVEVEIPEDAGITLAGTPVRVELTLLDDEGTARVSAIRIEVEELSALLQFDTSGILVRCQVDAPDQVGGIGSLPLMPEVLPARQAGPVSWLPTLSGADAAGVAYVRHIVEDRSAWKFRADSDALWLPALTTSLRPLFHGNTKTDTITTAAYPLRVGRLDGMLHQLRSIPRTAKLTDRAADWTEKDPGFLDVAAHTLAWMTSYILQSVDLLVADFMAGVSYLAPVRSEGTRFHRLMDLAVEEVDPRGENLAMFLRSLSPEEMRSMGDFTREHLGFTPELRIQGMQAEIRVSDPHVQAGVNIIDVGFGYSQVLPLAALVWSACVRETSRKRRRPTLLALEQPELHMHPAFQAQLAEMLVDASHKSREGGGDGVPMVIETHSQALVNGVGFLVEAKKISHEDVQVVLFDQNKETGVSQVRVVEYDPEGNLVDWPYGFFAPFAGD